MCGSFLFYWKKMRCMESWNLFYDTKITYFYKMTSYFFQGYELISKFVDIHKCVCRKQKFESQLQIATSNLVTNPKLHVSLN
jgi:hypothetical protein